MYEAFYGLTRRPFENTPNPEFFFASKQHREALAALVYGIKEAKGFMLITGDVGAGKTFLVHSLKYEMEEDDLIIVEAASPWVSPEELLDALPEKLGVKKEPQWGSLAFQERVKDKLRKKHAQGRRVVVIVDEAQQLPERTLEGIRLLSNYETEDAKLIQIILLGQPELNDMLARHSMRQVRQRIVLSRSLGYLSAAETKGYIEHRLKLSGQPDRLFDDESVALIYRVSQGAPRLINLLCDNCLITGYAHSSRMINPQIVREAIKELPMIAPQLEALHAPRTPDVPVVSPNPSPEAQAPQPVSEPKPEKKRSQPFEFPAQVGRLVRYGIWAVLVIAVLMLVWFASGWWNSRTENAVAAESKAAEPAVAPSPAADNTPRYVPAPDMSALSSPSVEPVPPIESEGALSQTYAQAPQQPAEMPLFQQMRNEIGVAQVRDDVANTPHNPPAQSETVAIESVSKAGVAQSSEPVTVGNFDEYERSKNSSARYGTGVPLIYPFDALALQLINPVMIPSGSTISQTARKQYGTWNDTVRDMVKALNPAFGGDLNNIDARLGVNLPPIKKAHLVVNQPGAGWYAYAGSLTSRSRANYLYDSFTKLGEPADMVATQVGGQNLYRVYIGPYNDAQQVIAVLDRVQFLHMPFLN